MAQVRSSVPICLPALHFLQTLMLSPEVKLLIGQLRLARWQGPPLPGDG
jgi:hypothetical protein